MVATVVRSQPAEDSESLLHTASVLVIYVVGTLRTIRGSALQSESLKQGNKITKIQLTLERAHPQQPKTLRGSHNHHRIWMIANPNPKLPER